MIKIANRKKRKVKSEKGFTLIELLVVISIIALLSTIVLGAVGDARVKAKNKKQNETALQYINAFELYYSKHNKYPSATGLETTLKCLSFEASDGECRPSTNGDTTLNSAVREFYPGAPKGDETKIFLGNLEYSGFIYKCNNTNCSSYELYWYLKNNNESCAAGAIETLKFGDGTRCYFVKN